MMQGDCCYLGIQLLGSGGSRVTAGDVLDVEVSLGTLRKTYRSGQLSCSGGLWLFPLSQGESFALGPGPVEAQVRVRWANGVVEGAFLPGVLLEESISKEVL